MIGVSDHTVKKHHRKGCDFVFNPLTLPAILMGALKKQFSCKD
jgi:hypothetical protein